MLKKLEAILQSISTDDEHNVVPGLIRVGWLLGLGVNLLGGMAMISALVRLAWFNGLVGDYSAFGIGFAAWSAGLSAYVLAGAGGLWMQAKADAVTPTPKVADA